jgi:hypothetical protein
MQVRFLKQESDRRSAMWEVHEGTKWWVAAWSVQRGGWTITTGRTCHEIAATGRLGKRIIAAVEAHKGNA